MKDTLIRFMLILLIFFITGCSITAIDSICKETTGVGGKLVFDVEKSRLFN